jgi:quinone-modifying oxidoreductase subunit QmoC
MNVMEIFGGHSVKDTSGFHAMLQKAEEIEATRIK